MSHWRGINSRKLMLSWGIGKFNIIWVGKSNSLSFIQLIGLEVTFENWKIDRVCKFVHAWKIVTNNNNIHLLVT